MMLASSFAFLSPADALAVEPKKECKTNRCTTFAVGMYHIKNTMAMNLLMEKEKGERLNIVLLDQRGHVLFREYVSRSYEKYGRRLSFEELGDGDYVLEISNDNEKITKNVEVRTDKIMEIASSTLAQAN